MLTPISKFIRAKIATLPYIQKAYGLATVIEIGADKETAPALNESGAHVPVNFDAHESMTYIRLTGAIGRDSEEHEYIACKYNITETYPLRIVLYVQGIEDIDCVSYSQNIAFEITRLLNGEQPILQGAIGAEDAIFNITDTTLIKRDVWNDEFSTDYKLQDKDILVAIDFDVVISGNEACFVNNPCDLPEFEFDFGGTCCYKSNSNAVNIGDGNTSVYHGLDGAPDLIQYWQGGNLFSPFITNVTNKQLIINSTDAVAGVMVNVIRLGSLCATQARRNVDVLANANNIYAHGLNAAPDYIAYFVGGYLLTQPFETTVSDTNITAVTTDDYLDVTLVALTFDDSACGNNKKIPVIFNTPFKHGLSEVPLMVQYWQKIGDTYKLFSGAFQTFVDSENITVSTTDEYTDVYVSIIG